MNPAIVGIVTVSDRAHAGTYEDRGGPALVEYLTEVLTSPWTALPRVVPDDRPTIAAALVELAEAGCCLIVTTGGTGPAPRDVTPEATRDVFDKELPGFGELMRQESLKKVPTAILSRQTAGVRLRDGRGTLIVNLPGQPRAIRECLSAVMPAIPYCIDLIGGPRLECAPAHVAVFRPKA